MTSAFVPMTFSRGPEMPNRFMLAPLTNSQSHDDGRLGDDEFRWLTKRAEGGFGATMTAAAHVQRVGQGFPGQIGVFSDDHLEGLTRLADAINTNGSLSIVQLHHAGMRSPAELIGEAPKAPSDDAKTGAVALSLAEVEQLRDDFIAAALRAEQAGFVGAELHGAHGYIIAQFLSPQYNQRTDRYGGSLENRARLLNEIIDGVRAETGPDFNLGLRLSPERFGLLLAEIVDVAAELLTGGQLDYLDMSLWDVRKTPVETGGADGEGAEGDRLLIDYFTGLDRGETRLGVAGKIMTPSDVDWCLDQGCDFVLIGRGAILHHDFPRLCEDPSFTPVALPPGRDHLRAEGLSETFIDYINGNWPQLVDG